MSNSEPNEVFEGETDTIGDQAILDLAEQSTAEQPTAEYDVPNDGSAASLTAIPEAVPQNAAAQSAAPPRTRWAGIVWGLVFVALAAAGISLAASPARFSAFLEWAAAATPAAITAYGLLAVGALVLLTGIVGLLRRAQRALARR